MSNTKQKILLIGGGGYLGTHLGTLLSDSFQITSTSRTKKENTVQLDLLQPSTFDSIKQTGPFNYIIILASTLKGLGTTAFKDEYISTDTIGLSHFLQFIADNKLSDKLIFTSSMTVYGADNSLPVKEEGLLNPLSTYGLSKMIAEQIISFYCKSTATKGVILRIPGIYGGNRTSGFIYNTAKKCLHNEPIEIDTSSLGYWETIHVNDLCKSIKAFIQQYEWKDVISVFNIGYGVKTDIIDCAKFIKKSLNSHSEIIHKGKKGYIDFYLDTEKFKKYASLADTYLPSLETYVKSIPA
ncbi:MAG TPA: SDR family oxidoreductase [Bacteroidia bacterium]|jgi:UDP-glucose 4-epimerase|nr:SDR family oxidoreductase [Bacteroidia bacterium]